MKKLERINSKNEVLTIFKHEVGDSLFAYKNFVLSNLSKKINCFETDLFHYQEHVEFYHVYNPTSNCCYIIDRFEFEDFSKNTWFNRLLNRCIYV